MAKIYIKQAIIAWFIDLAVTTLIIFGVFWFISKKTEEVTRQLIQDEIHTDWVRCAKECDSIPTLTIVLTADTTNVVGDAVR